MSFSPQQVHDDNIPQKSTPSSDIHVDWATEAMLQGIQCRFGLLFGGLKSTETRDWQLVLGRCLRVDLAFT